MASIPGMKFHGGIWANLQTQSDRIVASCVAISFKKITADKPSTGIKFTSFRQFFYNWLYLVERYVDNTGGPMRVLSCHWQTWLDSTWCYTALLTNRHAVGCHVSLPIQINHDAFHTNSIEYHYFPYIARICGKIWKMLFLMFSDLLF